MKHISILSNAEPGVLSDKNQYLQQQQKTITHLVTATATKGVDGAGFQTTAFPVTSASALFQPYTAHGKLNAEITPTTPEI